MLLLWLYTVSASSSNTYQLDPLARQGGLAVLPVVQWRAKLINCVASVSTSSLLWLLLRQLLLLHTGAAVVEPFARMIFQRDYQGLHAGCCGCSCNLICLPLSVSLSLPLSVFAFLLLLLLPELVYSSNEFESDII